MSTTPSTEMRPEAVQSATAEAGRERQSVDVTSQTQSEKTANSTETQSHHGELTTGEPPSEAKDSSPDQPDNPPPYSIYTLWEKRWIVLAASLSAFFSPLTAQIYLPALPTLSKDFNVSNSQINLTVTTYMIFQGVTPMFIGGLADTAGRRPAYLICFVVYIAANIGLALSKNYTSILVVRMLQSAGSSTTVALNQAVVADIITSAERGQYIGITVIPIVLAPSLGPVLGGILAEYLGWRSIFWFLTIAAGVTLVPMLLFFPETCRKIVGDGSVRPHPAYRTCWQMIVDWRQKRAARKTGGNTGLVRTTSTATSASKRPKFKLVSPNFLGSLIILFEKEVGLLLLYSGLVFAGFYAIATALPAQLQAKYGFNDVIVGLMYLPLAGGSIVTAFVAGPLINRNFRRHAARMGLAVDSSRQMDLSNFPIERARLEVGVPLLGLSIAVMLVWGWVMQSDVSVGVPCVLLFLMGVGMIGFVNTINTLLIDIYPSKAGAAVAANNLSRCLLGAAASAAIQPMITAMGSGWAFFLLGALYIVCFPMLLVVMKMGPKWRAEVVAKEKRNKEKKEAKIAARESAEASASTEHQGQGSDGVIGGNGAEAVEGEKVRQE
ncbi:MFS general substrate transporter [Coniochaeta ligniaria NRRL 30616]|uniref:MFS general substrate transporter n=1 Tax=Coniochaeta ligniaria NRRL 30616 TaxID=1408157 RepID=A0A1J7IYR1_9PEZI|nr:MFS general substrate transporter [Coniochaeta ligniaria NRRL 30616]